jgi:TRAP-type C4-dicarboxylate transport system substrate-binding protein
VSRAARLATIGFCAGFAALLAGCGAGRQPGAADKAGGSTGPVVLRLAASDAIDQPDSPNALYFAAQVAKLSGGNLRVHVTFQAAGDKVADVEARTAQLVRAGRFDLGWIGARAWDELGVTSFQALQAPFLITNYVLLDTVVKGPLANEMLTGLKSQGVTGLALIPGQLRHPIGLGRPLVSLSDFAGARIRNLPSKATDALLTALGAIPAHVSNAAIPRAIADHRIDGEELSLLNAPLGGIVSANVTFFGKALTLFAGERSFSSLSDEQRNVLRTAAERTLVHAATYPVEDALAFEGVLARQYCHRNPGRVVLADERQLQALVRATQPVYAELERDSQTKRLITAIRRLKASLPAPPPIVVPAECAQPRQTGVTSGQTRSSFLNGTYHWRLTEAAARAFGPPATNPENDNYPAVNAAVLRNGKVLTLNTQPPLTGTYAIKGDRITFRFTDLTYPLTFTFARDRDGTLRLNAVQPMDPGDQWVWSGAPWRRIGPPIATTP